MVGGSGPCRAASAFIFYDESGSEVVVRKILNYTPHVVTIYRGERVLYSYPSLGCARVVTKEEKSAHILGIPIKQITDRRVEGLPAPEEGTVYIVSSIVACCLECIRNDLLVPDTYASSVKVDDVIVGTTRFVSYSEVDFEPTSLTSFMETYQLRNLFPEVSNIKDFNPLYLYYKGIAEAGGRWQEKNDIQHWTLLTLDEAVNALTQRNLISKYVSAKDANITANNYIYSHAEVVVCSGQYYFCYNYLTM